MSLLPLGSLSALLPGSMDDVEVSIVMGGTPQMNPNGRFLEVYNGTSHQNGWFLREFHGVSVNGGIPKWMVSKGKSGKVPI